MQMLYQLSYPSKTLMTDPKIFSPGRNTLFPIRKLPVFSFLLAGDMRASASFPYKENSHRQNIRSLRKFQSGRWESNPHNKLGRLVFYH